VSLFVPSDLRNFSPSATTYVFFGRRGSGKTTIRLMMQRAYAEHNAAARAEGRSRGFFLADLSRPGHLTARLRAFRDSVAAPADAWDAAFCEAWTTGDLVDCVVSYVMTALVAELTDPGSVEGADMCGRLRGDACATRHALVAAHLYANADAGALRALRRALLRPRRPGGEVAAAVGAGAGAACRSPGLAAALAAPWSRAWEELEAAAPVLTDHPGLSLTALAAAAAAGGWALPRRRAARSLARAAAVAAPVRVVRRRPAAELAALLDATFHPGDPAEAVRSLCIGSSAHQKLDRASGLLRVLGYEGLAAFGDCFDEVSLLDPVRFPSAVKCFAREACRNDLLNFGRFHLFFPDSRLALDLNTDRPPARGAAGRSANPRLLWPVAGVLRDWPAGPLMDRLRHRARA
jgi:hypothetical protein